MPALLAALHRRPLVLLAVAAGTLAGVAAPAAAQSAPGAEAYFQPSPGDEDYAGYTNVVVRTATPLPLDEFGTPRAIAKLDGAEADMQTISRELGCYLVRDSVWRRGGKRATNGKVGDRVRVRIGRGGAILSRTLQVARQTPENARGGTLGCGADPASQAVIFNMYPSPHSQPGRFFFTANSGPYLKDITWTGWGSPTATGTGTYISDCASCGPKQEYAVDITVDRLVDCKPYGAKAYDRLRFVRAGGAQPDDPRRRGIAGEASSVYC